MAGNRSIPPMPAPPVSQAGEQDQADEPKKLAPNDPIKSLHARKGPIEVIALRPGLYKNQRIDKGKAFSIEKPEHLGSWMKCVDKTIQKEHEFYCREHKKRMQNLDRQSAGD